MSDWIGRTVSKVTIEKLLGRGGMADVYLGRHNTLNRPVAVKILQPHLVEDENQLRRFTAEAQSIAGLRHSHIVQVFDFDVVEERPYIVMELLPGLSLKDYLQAMASQESVPPEQVTARLFGQVAEALDYAHQRGIIHRDIKPANVMLRKEGGVIDLSQPLLDEVDAVLTDFGVARIADAAGQTASGSIIGTPAYMSPEQVKGIGVDPRSDIYSMGIMLYEMISGQLPFEGSTQASLLLKHMSEQPRPLPEADPAVQLVIDKALDKDPDRRPQTAAALANAYKVAVGLPAGDDPTPVEFVPAYDDDMGTMAMGTVALGETEIPTVEARPGGGDSTDEIPPARGTNPLVIAGSIAGLVALVLVILALAGLFGGGQADVTPPVTEASTVEAVEPTAVPTDLPEVAEGDDGSDGQISDQGDAAIEPEIDPTIPRGTVSFTDATMIATLTDIADPPEGFGYEAWLVDPENDELSLGVIEVVGGQVTVTYTDPGGGNVLAQYGGLIVSIEPLDDSDPDISGDVAYEGLVDEDLIAAFRLMDEKSQGAPFNQTVTEGLLS